MIQYNQQMSHGKVSCADSPHMQVEKDNVASMTYLQENASPETQKNTTKKKIRTTHFIEFKKQKKRISALTCYDSTFARLLENTPLTCVLVGDSLGQVIQGQTNTLGVTVDAVAYHVRCVASRLKTPLLIADMPFNTSLTSLKTLDRQARSLVQAGAEAVKIEGATPEILKGISFLVRHGIPVMGHLGLLPQSVHAVGGYKTQGKTLHQQDRLLQEAKRLEEAGCFAVVLELVEPALAAQLTESLTIPTIGIGCGNNCDGNILVLQDMLGMDSSFHPKFLKHFANLEAQVGEAVHSYCQAVQDGQSEPQP